MAEHEESMMEKIVEKIHDHDGSSSDSDQDDRLRQILGQKKPLHKIFGGGKVASVILWRDKKISGGVLGGATALWILFELLEYHLITLICHFLIISLAVLFLWSNATLFINKSPPKIPEIALPEKCIMEVAYVLRTEINRALDMVWEVASGKDLKTFLRLIGGLFVLSIIGNWFHFLTLFYIVFVLLHTLPVLYEKHQEHVDLYAGKAMVEINKQYQVLDEKVLRKLPIQQFLGQLKEKKKD